MKKVLILALMAASLFANGFTAGVEGSLSKSNVSATASGYGITVSDDYKTNTKGLMLKAGYAFDEIMVSGYYLKDTYKEGPLGDENAASYGVEVIYVTPIQLDTNFFMGGNIGKGNLDVIANSYGLEQIGFIDIGVKAGVMQKLNDNLSADAGIKIVKRTFDDTTVDGVTLEMDETQVGLFIGINFNL
jgi:opacity protein-like surface antigen